MTRIYNFHITHKELNTKYKSNEYKELTPFKKKFIKSLIKKDDKYYYNNNGRSWEIIPSHLINETIDKIYTDPLTGYKSRDALYNTIKEKYMGILKKDIIDYLSRNKTHQIHRIPKKSISKPILTNKPFERVQFDIIDLSRLSHSNEGYKYLLTVMDHYSKMAFAYPLKKKGETYIHINNLMDKYDISILQSDNALEFKDKRILEKVKEKNVKLINSLPYKPTSQGLIERFNRTIKGKIFKYMSEKNTKKYVDVLDDLITNYNNTVHSTTKIKPHIAKDGKFKDRVLDNSRKSAQDMKKNYKNTENIRKGSYVRISLNSFDNVRKQQLNKKSYSSNYTQEIYKVINNNFGLFQLMGLSDNRVYTRKYSANELIRVLPKKTQIRKRNRKKKSDEK